MPVKSPLARRQRDPNREYGEVLIRKGLRLGGVCLILTPIAMWLLVRLDWLDASALRLGPPIAVIGVALLTSSIILRKRGE
jgi:hypothetical protein